MDIRPTSQNFSKAPAKQKWPIVTISILVAIIIVLIAIVAYFFGERNASIQNKTLMEKIVPTTLETSKILPETRTESIEKEVKQPVQKTESSSQTPVDFDYELKQLDDQINSVSSTGLSDSEMSDAKAGL